MAGCDDRLLERLDDLERKVASLESRTLRFPGWLAILACGFAGGWFGRFAADLPAVSAQANPGQEIVARSLRIVDEQNRTLVQLAGDKYGGSGRFFNADGKYFVAVEGDPDGGLVRIFGHDGLERAFLGVGDKKGGGLMYFRNAEGKNSPVSVGVGPKGGYLSLNNLGSGKRSIWLGTDDDDVGGAAFIYDRMGFVRCDIGSNKQGGMVNLFGSKKGKSHVYLGTGSLDLGGLMLLRDEDGKVRAEIGQGRNGGYMTLNGNKDDKPHIGLATSDDQRGGYIQVRGNNGKVNVELGIDTTGQGYVDTFDKR